MTKTTVEFSIMVEGQQMLVRYCAYYFRYGDYAIGHLEFFSPHEPIRRIPISDTGYRSHFAEMVEIESFARVDEYAVAVVMAHRSDREQLEDDDDVQGSLF